MGLRFRASIIKLPLDGLFAVVIVALIVLSRFEPISNFVLVSLMAGSYKEVWI